MGTINYKTSDFVTVGYNCNIIDYDDEFYNEIIQDYFEQVNCRLQQEYFVYFRVTLEPGYYEGFSLDIEYNYKYCLDSFEDRALAQKEITKIKSFLLECINNFECCVVFPGWCTGYANYKDSIEYVNAATKEMRQTVKDTPTWKTLKEAI